MVRERVENLIAMGSTLQPVDPFSKALILVARYLQTGDDQGLSMTAARIVQVCNAYSNAVKDKSLDETTMIRQSCLDQIKAVTDEI